MPGFPVVVATNGYGMPVKQVTANAPVMTIAANGFGAPIVIDNVNGAPFVIEGLEPPVMQNFRVLSSDDGAPLVSESGEYLETYPE